MLGRWVILLLRCVAHPVTVYSSLIPNVVSIMHARLMISKRVECLSSHVPAEDVVVFHLAIDSVSLADTLAVCSPWKL